MDYKAEQKYLLMSPTKLRVVVEMVKKMKPLEAIDKLPFIVKRASDPLRKVIMQAVANAKVKGESEQNLVFKEIQVGEGPRLKRGQPVSRGQWHPIKKRMSHIRVVLTTRNAKLNTKDNEKDNNKSEKKGEK